MGAKASLHMSPMKSMDAALSDENERRGKNKEWFDRGTNSKGVPYHYDWWRCNLNFEIIKGKIVPQLSQEIPLHERLQNRLLVLGFRNYKAGASNAPNVCMDFVIGGNHERMTEMAFGKQVVNFEHPDEKNSKVTREKTIEQWAMDTYQWAAKKYGEENIVGFNVHLDETTPHIHMQVVPVGEVRKRGRVKAGEERGSQLAVSYAAVVGKTPEDLSEYLDNLHTDYHLQVGYKYGLERGTFFDDLTPEEQSDRKHRTKAEYDAFIKEKKEREENKKMNTALKNENAALKKNNDDLFAAAKLAEKKLKGLSTMLRNLEEQKEAIEIDIEALKEERDNGSLEAEKKLEELNVKLNQINEKIDTRNQQLTDTKDQLQDLAIRKQGLQNEYDETMRQYNKVVAKKVQIDSELEETDRELQRKRQEIEKVDKTGELARYKRYIEDRERIIFRRWPAAEAATHAIYERGSSRTATQFSPHQAILIEQAIRTSGNIRQEAAADLCNLVQKDFENNRTWPGWVEAAFAEVMQIADYVHPLSPFLQQQSVSGGGGASYINDLTGWDGKKRR